ncbi:DUF188 domain-containing protein [Bacillus sp. N9]
MVLCRRRQRFGRSLYCKQNKAGDVLITQDIGLASLVLSKGVYAISPRERNTRKTPLKWL